MQRKAWYNNPMDSKQQNNSDQSQSGGDTSYDQPVAYDKDGRPLYAHPPAATNEPQVVHMSRPISPPSVEISDDIRARHQADKTRHPNLNLSEGEYVISEVRRHPIGLIPPVVVVVFLTGMIIAGVAAYPMLAEQASVNLPPADSIMLPALLLVILAVLGGYIAITVYLGNKFYLTNESVIQEIQTALFARREQTVSLSNIEDASYRQEGFVQTLFNYGSIRLSTEGDETTYRFYYVANPKKQIATLNNAVEAFKNGRPVTGE